LSGTNLPVTPPEIMFNPPNSLPITSSTAFMTTTCIDKPFRRLIHELAFLSHILSSPPNPSSSLYKRGRTTQRFQLVVGNRLLSSNRTRVANSWLWHQYHAGKLSRSKRLLCKKGRRLQE
jgi:hypothetical protein